jgi:phosphoribosyl-ATP pyrophosphohydrolase/phosphoribosyl-AMP cyclohydrolase
LDRDTSPRLTLDELWQRTRPDDRGLVTAVVQHARTGQVLMVGHMSKAALDATLTRGRVTFWSRSRAELWEKGASSGNTLELRGLRIDCDGDALLVSAEPHGPTCHTGATSCFFDRVVAVDRGAPTGDDPAAPATDPRPTYALAHDDGPAPPVAVDAGLDAVFSTILARKSGRGMTTADGRSYVRSLLEAGAAKIGAKLREEADELARALADEPDARVDAEAADLVFHALVGLALRERSPADVVRVLSARAGVSGLDEKAARATEG